jgi:hypothetical protein
MVEADIHHRLLLTSIADIYNMVVSQTYGSTLTPLHRPSWSLILEFGSLVD